MRSTRWFLLPLLLALLWPAAALADARDDARRAFKTGMELIAQGQHVAGAELLKKAYDILPHPSVLYNIGLAYADAGEFGESVAAFNAYLASGPADAEAVERLVVLLRQQGEGSPAGTATATGPVLPGTEPTTTPSTGGAVVAGPEVLALLERLEKLAERLEGAPSPPRICSERRPRPSCSKRSAATSTRRSSSPRRARRPRLRTPPPPPRSSAPRRSACPGRPTCPTCCAGCRACPS